MPVTFLNDQQPAWRLLRFSMVLSLIGGIAFLLIFVIPAGWARNWELDWYLFWAGTSVSVVAIVLALIACAVRGADATVGSALLKLGRFSHTPPFTFASEMANDSVKIAPFGRWTPQKRGAFYLGRLAPSSSFLDNMHSICIMNG